MLNAELTENIDAIRWASSARERRDERWGAVETPKECAEDWRLLLAKINDRKPTGPKRHGVGSRYGWNVADRQQKSGRGQERHRLNHDQCRPGL